MTELLIRQGTLFHKILKERFQMNEQQMNQFQQFNQVMVQNFQEFTIKMMNNCRKYAMKKPNQNEDQNIIALKQYTTYLVRELLQSLNKFNLILKQEIVQPLQYYGKNQKKNSSEILYFSEKILYEMQSNRLFQQEINQNFQTNLKKNYSQHEKNLLSLVYESQIEQCRQNWSQFKRNYQQILQKIDRIYDVRCNFMIKMQVNFAKIINQMVKDENMNQILLPYEELVYDSKSLSISIKQILRQQIGNPHLFEDDKLILKDQNNSDIDDKLCIKSFVQYFISYSNHKQQQDHHSQARALILENQNWIEYFLHRMQQNLHIEINLSTPKYNQLTTIMKYILAITADNQNNQSILYSLLYITYRMHHNKEYIIKQLGKQSDYWLITQKWFNIISYILHNRNKNQKNILRKINNKKYTLNNLFRNGKIKNKIYKTKQNKNRIIIQNAKTFELFCQINYYMSRLELNQNFIFNFIVQQSIKYKLNYQNSRKLFMYHYNSKINSINHSNTNYLMRKNRILNKYKSINYQQKVIICISKAIKYLPTKSTLLSLRLVNHLWNQQLQSKLYARFLIYEEIIKPEMRLKIYRKICPLKVPIHVYQHMVEQTPMITEHSEIIFLDTNRSMNWKQQLRINLMQILKTYAYYHQKVGYLQGMNYLCEKIFKMTEENYIVYQIFQSLMNNQYVDMYNSNFDGLKLKIYQFMRILQRQKPALYDHFQTQNLLGEHFLLPWAITLWGQVSGQLCWVLWDGFILKGWKWWMKVILWLLSTLQSSLMLMNFEEMMKCLAGLNSSLLCFNTQELKDFGINMNNIKQSIHSIRIQEQLLTKIEEQYQLNISTVNKFLNKIQNNLK